MFFGIVSWSLRFALTGFVAILIPVYWKTYGPQNFLWLSDIGLLMTLIAVWVNSPLLISMSIIGILPLEILWTIDYSANLFLGRHFLWNITDYMFDPRYSVFVRALSFFHIILPIIWIGYWLKWGYDTRAFIFQTGLFWVIVILTYFLTDPKLNINFVFTPQIKHWTAMPMYLWLIILISAVPVFIYWPLHKLFNLLRAATTSV